jgi:hypothetical protein
MRHALRPIVPEPDDLSRYLATKVWQWVDGDPGGVLVWLQRLGCRITQRPEGTTWALRGLAGMTTTLTRDLEALAVASGIGALLGGMLWPQAFPTLLAHVATESTRRRRALAGSGEGEQ